MHRSRVVLTRFPTDQGDVVDHLRGWKIRGGAFVPVEAEMTAGLGADLLIRGVSCWRAGPAKARTRRVTKVSSPAANRKGRNWSFGVRGLPVRKRILAEPESPATHRFSKTVGTC